MDRQIIFYIEFESELKDTDSGILWFEWDGKSDVMVPAYEALSNYMKNKYPDEKYHIKDWEWADRR